MPISDLTGKVKSIPVQTMDAARNSPWVTVAVIATMFASMLGGVYWGVGKVEAAEEKADTAMQAVKSMEGKLDILIQMQMLQMQAAKIAMPTEVIVASQNPRRIVLDTIRETVFVAPVDTVGDTL